MKKIIFSFLMLCCVIAAVAQPSPGGGYTADSYEKLKACVQNAINNGIPTATIKLTADIYLKDEGELCSTFKGTLDGNGHTIYAGDETAHHDGRGLAHGKYLFTYSDGATFKNLTFKDFRADTQQHSNWSILTSQAKNGCVFENITFDHVSIFSNYNNIGAVAGIANNCTFKNITVRNSDFTVDGEQSGAVVGYAEGCTFTNIKVESCENTSDDEESGGVVGYSNNCSFNNVEILDCFIKTYGASVGGVAGYSTGSRYTNCTIDDQSCVCADGSWSKDDGETYGYAGGIVGCSKHDNVYNCINSALIASDGNYTGGIVGYIYDDGVIDMCLNTGMVISIKMDDVKGGFYNKYKTKTGMTCVAKAYQGKEYVIRQYDGDVRKYSFFGGIVGCITGASNVSKCANLGSVWTNANGGIKNDFLSLACGGIAGLLAKGTISDCLSDFSGKSVVKGICGKVRNGVIIKNCLNMTTYKDFSTYDIWEDCSGTNNYSLTSNPDAPFAKITSESDLKSGKICCKLGEAWEQNLGTDAYPIPTGSKGLYHARNVSNEYGTVCFPFPVQSDDNIHYYTFSNASNFGGEMQLMFEYAGEKIPAGTPLLYRVRNTGENIFSSAAVGSNEWAEKPIEPEDKFASWDSWDFLGTFEELEFSATAYDKYYVSNGAIKNAKHTTVPAYRAYFRGPDIKKLTSNQAQTRIRIVVEDEDGETTAISLVNENYNENENENFGGKTYSLMGTEVGEGYRGIVIKNGKKYINR